MARDARSHRRKVAVTGGSSGIGLACAIEFARRGYDVALVARDIDKLKQAREQVFNARSDSAGIVLCKSADLADQAACDRVFEDLAGQGFEIDVLVNSAGLINPGEFVHMSEKQFSDNLDYGFWTVVHPCRSVAPRMVERGCGHIVNVSSVAGFLGIYGYTGYSAAKFATMGFTEALRCEMAPEGVRVSIVCPPDTDTPALARERAMRPHETDVVAGNLKAVEPAVIARAVVRGVEKGRYLIIPGALSKFYFRLKGVLPELAFAIIDSDVRKARRGKGE